jgi:DNA-binding MarR family transcriptional regulator
LDGRDQGKEKVRMRFDRHRPKPAPQSTDDAQGQAMSEKYINAAQQRVLRTLLTLAEHDLDGLLPGEIARNLDTLPSNTTRDLANLRLAGLAESLPNGRWRIAPRLVELALALQRSLDSAQRKLEETRRRYSRE